MSGSPLRRLVALAGLVAMLPVAASLAFGRVTLADAGLRAGAVFVGVIVVGRLVAVVLRSAARDLDDSTGSDRG